MQAEPEGDVRGAAKEIYTWREKNRRGEERVLNINIIILRSIYTERNIPALSFRLFPCICSYFRVLFTWLGTLVVQGSSR